MPVSLNKDLETVIRATATETLALSALAAGSQTVSAASINKILWSGNWTVARGANTKFVLAGSGAFDLDSMGMACQEDKTANLVLTLVSGTGSIVVKCKKEAG